MADVTFHSSGSTGAAKRIVRTEASLQADAASLVASFPEIWAAGRSGIAPYHRAAARPLVAATVRPDHMYGALWAVRAPQAAGCAVCPGVLLSVEEILAVTQDGRPILLVTTPSFLDEALRHPDFPKLRGCLHDIITSGSALRPDIARAVFDVTGICPLEVYGSTEVGTIASRRATNGEAWTLVEGVSAAPTPDGLISIDSPFALKRPFVLNDRVAFLDAHHFLLKGRADRQVKILEQFVSLSKVEEAFASHPFVARVRVEPFGSGVERLGALVELTEEGAATLAKGTLAQGAALLRDHARQALAPLEMPRRIRFVHRLPTNAQGKTTRDAVLDALSAWCPEPPVLAWRATQTQLALRLALPPDLTCFKGHFPSLPVLPGVAQLAFVRHFARQVFPDFPETCNLRKLKFKKVVLPGTTVDLVVSRKSEGVFAFAFDEASQGEVVAK